jgi:hypothetical protein
MSNPNPNPITAEYIGKYSIIRGRGFGVFAGTVTQVVGDCVKLANARRLWYWDGAASISQIAAEGVAAPQNCKFSVAVESITLRDWIEIIPCTEQATAIIQGVKEWKR